MARVLITGSVRGFGRLAALTLARQGLDVIATTRDPAGADDLAALIEAESLPMEIRQLDVCDPVSVETALADAGQIDALVNNAGIEVQSAVEHLSDELMWRQLDTNVMGPLRIIRAVLPHWTERGSGVIVNISSIAGLVGTPYGAAYAGSKHAIEAISESLHFEVSHLGLRVHVIEPGSFPTGLRDRIVHPPQWEGSSHQQRSESYGAALDALRSATGPPADPQVVADAIARAVTDPSTPFRVLCGHDAELIASTKSSMSFDEFDDAMRATLGWTD